MVLKHCSLKFSVSMTSSPVGGSGRAGIPPAAVTLAAVAAAAASCRLIRGLSRAVMAWTLLNVGCVLTRETFLPTQDNQASGLVDHDERKYGPVAEWKARSVGHILFFFPDLDLPALGDKASTRGVAFPRHSTRLWEILSLIYNPPSSHLQLPPTTAAHYHTPPRIHSSHPNPPQSTRHQVLRQRADPLVPEQRELFEQFPTLRINDHESQIIRKMSHHAPTSRPKPPPPGSEEASSILNLGEFQHVDTLTLSEASLVINALVTKRKMDRKNINETEMLTQTLNYLDAFSRFRQKENVEAVERLLSAHKQLAKFERAQIGSLCCETAEEAKTLIPSLQDKISDDDLQILLDEISKLQSR
ncbi:RNA polymerase Rpb4 [Colletotrichum nymphaeae SA-01]|uniref:RNA polymerase Rpb4 n=1 Tax=Colletotrichum nymphaeae SA-01 TaxID=1460502 RepID=A0A135SUL9_9PEZI|nr:RNA polymerase Rpb4 [Colletotrichum nymphaeae SA-01]